LQSRIEEADEAIRHMTGSDEGCQRLVAISGIAATAIIAAIGNGAAFTKGRGFSAWLGLVPAEHTTGGKQRLLGISKRGNSYLRRLFIQGAHAVLLQRAKQSSALSAWLAQLTSRAHRKVVVVVALANKLARTAWAVLATNQQYSPRVSVNASDHTTGLQMTPPIAGLEIAYAIPTSATQLLLRAEQFPARSAGEL
jgi:transposase